MSVTSCQQKIPLGHKYYNIFPLPVEPVSAETLTEAILYTYFVLNQHMGLTQMDWLQYMAVHFPQYSSQEIESELDALVRSGVLVTLQPVCRDWCADECPVKSYAISSRLDQLPAFNGLVLFLIGLAGGTRVTSVRFNQLFLANRNLQGGVASTKRQVIPSRVV
jgi:hypothetical protein